mmetsp:Transcript_70357/g.215531  ORF Transcript_70357/g.215531 Transcript_70357/m.215531 type:complete len:244 (+) Transcript_70357:344-1075(+)
MRTVQASTCTAIIPGPTLSAAPGASAARRRWPASACVALKSAGMEKPTSTMNTAEMLDFTVSAWMHDPHWRLGNSTSDNVCNLWGWGGAASSCSSSRITQPTVNAGNKTSRCTVSQRSRGSVRSLADKKCTISQKKAMLNAYSETNGHVAGKFNLCKKKHMKNNKIATNMRSIDNSHLSPTKRAFKGTMSSKVSRSSKIARMRAFWKSQVFFMPAASNIVKRIPADVGAAKRPAINASCQGRL